MTVAGAYFVIVSMNFLAAGAVSSDPAPEKTADLDDDEIDDTRAKSEVLDRPQFEGADDISKKTGYGRKRIQPEFHPPDTRKYVENDSTTFR